MKFEVFKNLILPIIVKIYIWDFFFPSKRPQAVRSLILYQHVIEALRPKKEISKTLFHCHNGVRIMMCHEGDIYPFINNPLTLGHTQALV